MIREGVYNFSERALNGTYHYHSFPIYIVGETKQSYKIMQKYNNPNKVTKYVRKRNVVIDSKYVLAKDMSEIKLPYKD